MSEINIVPEDPDPEGSPAGASIGMPDCVPTTAGLHPDSGLSWVNPLRFWSSSEMQRPFVFLFRLLGESLLLVSILHAILSFFLNPEAAADPSENVELDPRVEFVERHWFLVGVIALPFIETLLLQWLPMELTRRSFRSFWPRVLPSMVLFALAHFTNSAISGICAGTIGGWYLALAYFHFRTKSVGHAIAATFFLHAAYNFVLLAPD
jgi:Type II CAAX prenyl endopeptidase Rce1-like